MSTRKQNGSMTRRRFLQQSSQAATIGAVGWAGARSAKAAADIPKAHDKLVLGLIGSGNQGTNDMLACLSADNVICTAICDIAKFRLDWSKNRLAQKMNEQGHGQVKIDTYHDFNDLLARKDIDGVIIATPDHWHHRAFLAALKAGKHIYQEKPMCYTYQQGLEMVAEAKKRPELVVQIGTQRRSHINNRRAKEFIDSGKLGKIYRVAAFDTRNWFFGGDPFFPKGDMPPVEQIDWTRFEEPCEKKHAFDPYRYFTWRWYWAYAGGLMNDVGIHVMDIVHMLTGNKPPISAVCNGGVYAYKKWETPDVVTAVWDYGDHAVTFSSNFLNEYERDGLTLYGTHGTIDIRGTDIKVWEEGKRDKPIHHWPIEDVIHQHNWLRAIRGEEKPNAPVELGFSSLLPSLLANIAYREGKKVIWDPKTNEAKLAC